MLFIRKLGSEGAGRMVAVIAGLAAAIIMAVTSAVAVAAVAQGFQAVPGQTLVPGMLAVSQQHQGEVRIAAASGDTADKLVGVVVAADEAVLVTNAAAPVKVATGGSTQAFVSDLAGPVRAGDAITASPLAGIGMKANASTRIVGVAEAGFDRSSAGEWRTVRDRDGQASRVRVGLIALRLEATSYTPPVENTVVPAWLQQFSNQVAGRPVSAWRVLAGFGISLAALVAVGSILFAAIKSGMISMGRNPLAARHIYRGVWRAFGMSAVILVVAIGATYCIMRL